MVLNYPWADCGPRFRALNSSASRTVVELSIAEDYLSKCRGFNPDLPEEQNQNAVVACGTVAAIMQATATTIEQGQEVWNQHAPACIFTGTTDAALLEEFMGRMNPYYAIGAKWTMINESFESFMDRVEARQEFLERVPDGPMFG